MTIQREQEAHLQLFFGTHSLKAFTPLWLHLEHGNHNEKVHSCAILGQRKGLEATVSLRSLFLSTVHWHIYKFSKKKNASGFLGNEKIIPSSWFQVQSSWGCKTNTIEAKIAWRSGAWEQTEVSIHFTQLCRSIDQQTQRLTLSPSERGRVTSGWRREAEETQVWSMSRPCDIWSKWKVQCHFQRG